MAVCTYDNPVTMARECWQDGRLLFAYSALLFIRREPIPPEWLFFGANVGPWQTGQLWGDREALTPKGQDA